MTKDTITDLILGLALAGVCLASLGWLLTHMGCAHPIGNLIAFVLYVASGVPLVLPPAIAWFERNLPETGEEER